MVGVDPSFWSYSLLPPVPRARVPEVAVRALLLPRAGPREEDVRPDRVEHPVRVQRVGPQDIGAAVGHVPQRKCKVCVPTRARGHF